MERLYKKNLELFKLKFDKNFIDDLQQSELSAFSIDSKNNDVDIYFGNEKIYPFGAKKSATLQVDEFIKNPKSYSMAPAEMGDPLGEFQDKYAKLIEQLLQR